MERWTGLVSASHARKRVRVDEPVGADLDMYGPPTGGIISARAPKRTMVRTRTRRRTRRRRRGVRRYGRRRDLQPLSVVRKLKTVFTFDLDSAASTLQSVYLKLNSAFDPSGNVGSNQGLGFDQYTALYNRYSVIGWSVKIEFVTTDNTHPCVIGFTPSTSSTPLTTYLHYKEVPGTNSLIVTPDVDKGRLFSRGSVKRWLLPGGGRLLGDDTLHAGVAADPEKLLYGHVWTQPVQVSADPATVRFIVTMYQVCVFFDPVVPARS